MDRVARERRPVDWLSALSTAALICVMLTFAYVHLKTGIEQRRPVGLGLVIQETLVVLLLLTRRRARSTDGSLFAMVVTGFGSFGMFLCRPTDNPVLGLGLVFGAMQLIGVLLAAVSLGALGRSFGLVAANRGIQTHGAYRIVRHPAYACYAITHLGYLLENPSAMNIVVFVCVYICQFMRIRSEEAHLSADPAYRAYRERVRYRLIPFLY